MPDHPLTERELETLRLVVAGYQYKQIAARLGVTLETVKERMSKAFDKTGTRDKTQLVVWAWKAGLWE